MSERALAGMPAAPGLAVGAAWLPDREIRGHGLVAPGRREQERDRALAALAAAAEALVGLAAGLPGPEAEIVEAGALMAQDPALRTTVEDAVLDDGLAAADAILQATERYAAAIAAVADETLAARAADVRSLGRRAARLTAGREFEAPPGRDLIMVARDLGPADVAEAAPALAGVALAGGGVTAHAAIVARSLGIPMVTGLGDQILEVAEGATLVLDGSSGAVRLDPSGEEVQAAAADMHARALAERRARALRDEPAVTVDGTRMTVWVNVATAEELEAGLRVGAEGIGLLRTELAFLDAEGWPSAQEHARALAPILAGIGDRPAVVRVLDFGADKSPPFLHGVAERGIELLLAHPDAFSRQLRAILLAAQGRDVRILLPMVDTVEQLTEARALIERVAATLSTERIPPIGPMIETPAAVRNAYAIAERSAFLSVGTNDLTAATLGVARFAENAARAHDPKVLRSIARSVGAAHEAGIPIEVCGEAASDPVMLPLLVGAGVDQVSVGAARLGEVRSWIRQLDAREAAGLFHSALTMDSAEEVEWAVRAIAAELQAERREASAIRAVP